MTIKRVLIVIVLALISFLAGAYYRFNKIDMPVPRPTPTVDPSAVISDDDGDTDPTPAPIEISGRINLLVLGEDNVDSVKRSDTMMFVAIDVDERNIRVLSLPRDTRVAIPRHGNQKLNHAYAFGGVELLRSTIERFLGTPIHYYVKIDYDNFPRLVDAVGGVDIFVGRAMKYTDRKQKLFIDIPVGKQRMNGDTALKYVRFRNDALGDIGRIRRQQQFLKGFLHRLYQTENLLRFPSVLEEIQNTLKTDMEPSMVLQLGYFMRRLEGDQNRIFFKMLPGQAAIVDGLSYWIADNKGVESFLLADLQELADLKTDVSTAADFTPDSAEPRKQDETAPQQISEHTGDEIRAHVRAIDQSIAILNGTGRSGLANTISSNLQKLGVDVTHVGNAKHFDYKNCIVIYPEGASQQMRDAARSLAKLCALSDGSVRADRQATYLSLVVGHNYETLVKRLENAYEAVQ